MQRRPQSLLQHVEQSLLGIAPQDLSFFLPWPTATNLALYFNIDFSRFGLTQPWNLQCIQI